MDAKKVYDIVMESERQANLMHIAQNNRERAQFSDKDYTDVALEACKKFNSQFEGTFDDRTIEKDNENVVKLSEIQILTNLQTIINDMGLSHEFSLGESREQCVCLRKNENMWEVYVVERGIVFDKSTHEELNDACIEVIHQLSDSKEIFKEKKLLLNKKI